ncbi:hypothetical protein HW555_005707 [Spodoptera exigua]|uniref:Uncharacterized protein n=1 Tax=Spodoptera exigua TaxID=7107 RepID=A0A835GK48_SPOEX|nr:hypothetical protein HW555_005707 [Spodoptera exigua]
MADTLKTLLRKRSALKSKLTIYSNFINLVKSSAHISEMQRLDLQERFNKFDSLHSQFDELQTEIELLADDAETAFVEREEFDRQFFNLVALTRSLLGSSVNGAGSEAGFKDADSERSEGSAAAGSPAGAPPAPASAALPSVAIAVAR